MQNREELIASNLSENEFSRYARHLSLPEIGIEGQDKLKRSSVLCIGCGGLGSPLLIYLAAAGLGRIGIVDSDYVEESNLQRQVIHNTNSIGKKKITSAKDYIKQLNPYSEVITYDTKLNNENALEIINSFDVICDCTDNFPSRYLINDACIILKKPNVFGSVAGFEGQVSVFNLNLNSPNYRDLIPIPPPKDVIPTCAENGVMGIVTGIIGLIQATETIKIITGSGEVLNGRVLIFDALKMVFKELNLTPTNSHNKISKLIDYDIFCSSIKNIYPKDADEQYDSISILELKSLIKLTNKEIAIIDVRDEHEFHKQSIKGAILIPLKKIKTGKANTQLKKIASQSDLYIYCKSGTRSISAIKELRRFGLKGINIIGGIDAWNEHNGA